MYINKLVLLLLFFGMLISCEGNKPTVSSSDISGRHEITASELNFGLINASDSVAKELVLKNTSATENAYALNFRSSSNFKINNAEACTFVGAGKSCAIQVEFTPNKYQRTYTGSILVSYIINSETKNTTIALSGSSTDQAIPIGPGDITVENTNFGTVTLTKDDELRVNLTIKNNYANNTISQITLNKNSSFVVDSKSTCMSLHTGESCVLVLKATSLMNTYNEPLTLSYKVANQGRVSNFHLTGNVNTQAIEALKEDLTQLLTTRDFDDSQIKDFKKNYDWNNINYSVDNSGKFFGQDVFGNKFKLDLEWNKPASRYQISDKNHFSPLPNNPLIVSAQTDIRNAFNGLAQTIRERGIYSMKSLNPPCYYAYAAQRLKTSNPYERLMAMERAVNPRPLIFRDDAEWEDFKHDIRNLFKEFRGPQSHVVLFGTSTTFFSQNPQKGKNDVLFETAPACVQRAKDPVFGASTYTFDTPGHPMSDLDIHVFIPELSELCEAYDKTLGANVINNGKRVTYLENYLNKCFPYSSKPAVRALVDASRNFGNVNLPNAVGPNSPFGKFFNKWGNALNHRDIGFSVHIRPDQLAHPLTGETDFENDVALKRRFRIDIN